MTVRIENAELSSLYPTVIVLSHAKDAFLYLSSKIVTLLRERLVRECLSTLDAGVVKPIKVN